MTVGPGRPADPVVKRTAAGNRTIRAVTRRIRRIERDWADQVGAERYDAFRACSKSSPSAADPVGQPPASSRRAAATMSALVLAWPSMPQPPSGDSEMSTQVRSTRVGSPAAAATRSVSSRDDAELLVAVENADRGEHLHPHVVAVAGGVGDRVGRQVVHEGGGVVLEQVEMAGTCSHS